MTLRTKQDIEEMAKAILEEKDRVRLTSTGKVAQRLNEFDVKRDDTTFWKLFRGTKPILPTDRPRAHMMAVVRYFEWLEENPNRAECEITGKYVKTACSFIAEEFYTFPTTVFTKDWQFNKLQKRGQQAIKKGEDFAGMRYSCSCSSYHLLRSILFFFYFHFLLASPYATAV